MRRLRTVADFMYEINRIQSSIDSLYNNIILLNKKYNKLENKYLKLKNKIK